ncbi:hypothetical protein [Pseudoxanthomonas sp. X-1]|uniref:hypothetical protein n=1 Tax=Pseudoxanthomonas sp. X-1 TaxID=2571115 RepID=UPI000DB89EFF|nr:hypothetical protein [Pseudoxanthomonas sp. X-1]PZP60137.1 MAG: hypothetical protein DI597_13715 [Pseudoxanthomonas spadix]TMN17383.1 hypothetical protein FF950_17140 [Pseudoxanthomonas sp. X-1]UAY74427.1 hypothetical protein LAJ50_18580 [Pseudoxanthomonas sp. X-1]
MTHPNETAQVMGLIALELAGGAPPRQAALPQAEAGALAEKIARDLAGLVPQVTTLELTLAAAHFDPAEALRPGWPLHRRLDELRQRAPGRDQGPRVIAFGAASDGQVPMPFQADPDLTGGALRVLPFLLSGTPEDVDAVGEALEEVLIERGMAGADTALQLQDGLGAKVEHVRFMTLHDLAAMMALQYQHQHLEGLWPLIETALLAPDEEQWLDAPPEPLLRYADGQVQMALLDAATWKARNTPGTDEPERLARAYEHYLMRKRQLAAVLEAHGIPVTYVHCPGEGDLCAHLRS